MKRFLTSLLLALSTSVVAQNRLPAINLMGSDPTGTACSAANSISQYNNQFYTCDPATSKWVGAGTAALSNYMAKSGGRFTGQAGAPDFIVAGGLSIDPRWYGALCDGSTDDISAFNTVDNLIMLYGGHLILPEAQTCVLKSSLVFNFNTNNTPEKIIDLNGGRLLFEQSSPGQTDLKFMISGAGSIEVENIKIENGTIEDFGGTNAALIVVDFNGGGGSTHFLNRVVTQHVHVVADPTTVATVGIHLRSIYQSHFDNTTVDNNNVTNAWDWFVEHENVGDQATGDLTFNDCEGIGGDRGWYDTSSGDNRVNGGTWLQTKEEGLWASGVRGDVFDAPHVENSWLNNTTGTYRADIYCAGVCTIEKLFDYSAGGSLGQRNVLVYAFNNSGDTIIKGVSGAGGTFKTAYVQTGTTWQVSTSSGHITLTGVLPSEVTDGNGSSCGTAGFCSNLTFLGEDGSVQSVSGAFQSLTVNGVGPYVIDQSTPQWVKAGSSYKASWHNVTFGTIPEEYFAVYSGTPGAYFIAGKYINNFTTVEETCTETSGVTPPNLGNPAGCVPFFQYNGKGGNVPFSLNAGLLFASSQFYLEPNGGLMPTLPANSDGSVNWPTTWQSGSIPYFTNNNGFLGGLYTSTNTIPTSLLPAIPSSLLPATTMYSCGTLTTTAATSDSLTCSFVTTSSHCTASASNATASTLTGVYVPTPAVAGTVVLDHSASAGGTFTIACSTN